MSLFSQIIFDPQWWKGVASPALKLARRLTQPTRPGFGRCRAASLCLRPAGGPPPGRAINIQRRGKPGTGSRSEGNASQRWEWAVPIRLPAVPVGPISVTAAALWDQRKAFWGRLRRSRVPEHSGGPDRLDPQRGGQGRSITAGRQVPSKQGATFQWALGQPEPLRARVSESRTNVAPALARAVPPYVMAWFDSQSTASLLMSGSKANRATGGKRPNGTTDDRNHPRIAAQKPSPPRFTERYSEILGKGQRNPDRSNEPGRPGGKAVGILRRLNHRPGPDQVCCSTPSILFCQVVPGLLGCSAWWWVGQWSWHNLTPARNAPP